MADGKGTSGCNQRGREIWPNRKGLSSFYALRRVATGRSAVILSTISRPERRFHQANWNAMLVVESFALAATARAQLRRQAIESRSNDPHPC